MIDFDIKAATKGELLYKIAALQLALDCTRNEDKAEYCRPDRGAALGTENEEA